MKITISKAKISDVSGIKGLEEHIWKDNQVDGRYEVGTVIRNGCVFVAKDRKRIIGAILASRTWDNKIFVDDWIVHGNYRGHGVGHKLYKKLMASVGNKSIVSIIHPKDKESLKIHLKELNFRVVKRVRDFYGINDGSVRFLVERKAKAPELRLP